MYECGYIWFQLPRTLCSLHVICIHQSDIRQSLIKVCLTGAHDPWCQTSKVTMPAVIKPLPTRRGSSPRDSDIHHQSKTPRFLALRAQASLGPITKLLSLVIIPFKSLSDDRPWQKPEAYEYTIMITVTLPPSFSPPSCFLTHHAQNAIPLNLTPISCLPSSKAHTHTWQTETYKHALMFTGGWM